MFAQFAPYELAEGDWDSRRDQIGALLLDEIAVHAPDVRDCVDEYQVLGPPDIERRIGLTGGHIFQGQALPGQMWDRRLEAVTPVEGVYLCGAATTRAARSSASTAGSRRWRCSVARGPSSEPDRVPPMEAATPPAPPPRPAHELTVGNVISEAFRNYGAHFATLIGVAIVVFVIAGLIQGLLQSTDSWVLRLLGSIVSLVAGVLYTGFVVSLVSDVRDGKRDFTVGELLSSASPAILPLIGNGILFGIAVGIGLFLLIIPGLWLLTIWAVVAPAIVIESRGAIEAFGRSYDLVRGHGWTVFGAIVVAWLILVGFGILAAVIGVAIADAAGSIILSIIVSTLAAPFAALVASVLFFDLREQEGSAVEPAAAPPPPAPAA